MDGLSSAASIIAVVQLTGSIVKICGGYIQEVKDARDDIITLQRTLTGLEGVLHNLKDLLQNPQDTKLPTSSSLINNISDCTSHLQNLEEKIDPGRGKRLMRRLGFHALKWPLKRTEVNKIIEDLERYKSSFTLSLQVDQTIILSGLTRSADRLDQYLGFDKLPVAYGAEFDSYSDQHEDECLPGTRTELLRQVAEWAVSPQGQCIYWLNGMAGTGKSTVSRTTAKSMKGANLLGASFFFRRGEGDRGNTTKLFSTITRQLVVRMPELIPGVQKALDNDPNLMGKSLKEQFDKILLQPLLRLESTYLQTPTVVIVIDALDECEQDEDMRIILHLLLKLKHVKAVHLRIFLTSRPEWPILQEFSKIARHEHKYLVLHEIPMPVIEHDISLFLKHRLSAIRTDRLLSADWPGNTAIQSLVKISVPLFIFAATACRLIEDPQWDPVESLAEILADRNDGSHFVGTYLPVLNRLLDGQSKKQEMQLIQEFQAIIGPIVMLESPLSIVSLSRFLGLTEGQIHRRLKSLHSVLHIPSDLTRPVRLFHLSFRDFLLDQETRDRTPFWVDEKQTHQRLTSRCLYVCDSLRKNICGIKYGTKRVEIDNKTIFHCLPPELQYSCRYWAYHLTQSKETIIAMDEALLFLEKHFLHWIEAMSLLGLASEVVGSISLLQSVLDRNANHKLSEFLHDAKRFFLKNRQIADDFPLQIYCAGLIFAPKMTIIRKQFGTEQPKWIRMLSDIQEEWNAELQTLEGHSRSIGSVAFSHYSRLLASGSDDHTVRLWDAATGALKQTLEGHSGPVSSVTFSDDGRLLASGSNDHTVRLWDPATGALQLTLESLSGPVHSVAFARGSKLLASGSDDQLVRLWDLATGALKQSLEGHSGPVSSVTFSDDGRLLASGSNDHTVRLWDPATGTLQRTLEGHSGPVSSVNFSDNGRLLASGSNDHTVRLWDPATGTLEQTLEGHSGPVRSVAFAHGSKLLASGSHDRTIQLWELATGVLRQKFEGHSRAVRSVAFSHDNQLLASSSYDMTVRLWDSTTGGPRNTGVDHSGPASSVTFSDDGRLLASGSDNGAVLLLNPATGALRQTLQGHSDVVRCITFSGDGRLLASGSDDHTVRLWDSAKGALRHIFQGHSGWVRSVAFSHDSRLLASGSHDMTVRLCDPVTGALKQTLEGHLDIVFSVAFARDSKLLASGSHDRTVRLWDPATGALQYILQGHSHGVRSVAFSHDSRLLASGSYDLTVRLWDLATDTLQQTLESKRVVTALEFSADGSYLNTNLGYLKVQPSRDMLSPTSPRLDVSTFFIEGEWVTLAGEKTLWLPPEYRPDSSTVRDNVLVWGHALGGVSIIEFCT